MGSSHRSGRGAAVLPEELPETTDEIDDRREVRPGRPPALRPGHHLHRRRLPGRAADLLGSPGPVPRNAATDCCPACAALIEIDQHGGARSPRPTCMKLASRTRRRTIPTWRRSGSEQRAGHPLRPVGRRGQHRVRRARIRAAAARRRVLAEPPAVRLAEPGVAALPASSSARSRPSSASTSAGTGCPTVRSPTTASRPGSPTWRRSRTTPASSGSRCWRWRRAARWRSSTPPGTRSG